MVLMSRTTAMVQRMLPLLFVRLLMSLQSIARAALAQGISLSITSKRIVDLPLI